MRTWVEIYKNNIGKNYNSFRKITKSNCLIMSVVKSNAYGHNLIDFSKIVEKKVDWLGVDSIIEAETLRKNKIKKPILVLGYTIYENLEKTIKNEISITLSDFDTLKSLKKISDNKRKKLKIHIKIDTGMHRQGFLLSELPEALKIIKKEKIPLEGIYTHFSCAKDPFSKDETLKQIKKFKEAIKLLENNGFINLIKHASSTGGSIIFPESHFDMVRIGIGMYGLWPSKKIKDNYQDKINLFPVLSWKTIVGQIKKIPKGSRIGYDLTEKLKRDSRIAVLPIGYWHGFSRSLSSKGLVLIKGEKAKVLGRVSMDMISVDITDISRVKVKDEVVIIGSQKKETITADDIAKLTNTTSYEIITTINSRIKKIVK